MLKDPESVIAATCTVVQNLIVPGSQRMHNGDRSWSREASRSDTRFCQKGDTPGGPK